MKSISLTLISIVALCSCTQDMGTYTAICPKPIDTKAHYYTSNDSIEGKEVAVHHVIIVPITTGAKWQDAVSRAMEKAGPNCVGLANVNFKNSFWWIPYIYGQTSYTAKGNPIYKR